MDSITHKLGPMVKYIKADPNEAYLAVQNALEKDAKSATKQL